MNRPVVIGVMGGGSVEQSVSNLAYELGAAIANEGWTVLTGGRNVGVMAAVSHGASDSGGLVVGVLPDRNLEQASPHITVPIVTGMGDARNVINILSSDVIVALPGSAGTLSEIALALKNEKPLFLLGWDTLPVVPGFEDTLSNLPSISELLARIREALADLS